MRPHHTCVSAAASLLRTHSHRLLRCSLSPVPSASFPTFPVRPPTLIPRTMTLTVAHPLANAGCPRGQAHAAHGGSPRPDPAHSYYGTHSGWQHTPGAGAHVNTARAHTHSHRALPHAVGLLTGWHTGCRVCWAWQLQGSQPRGPPRFQKRGAQRLQSHPRVWGRQGHCPLTWSQKQASALDGHRAGTVPRGSQVQAWQGWREEPAHHLGPSSPPTTHSRRQPPPPGRRALPWKPGWQRAQPGPWLWCRHR